jgi:rhodanese-related sulfurtransferase
MIGKKHLLQSFALGIGLALLPACWWDSKTTSVSSGQSSEKSALKVINLLSKDLVDDATIAGSTHIPMDKLEAVVNNWDRKTPIVVYCANYACTSSTHAAKKLAKMGFENVKAYEGGTAEWYQLSKQDPRYIIAGPAQQSYLSLQLPISPVAHEGVETITAEQLYKIMHEAGLQ